jgi:hypothetical protein
MDMMNRTETISRKPCHPVEIIRAIRKICGPPPNAPSPKLATPQELICIPPPFFFE